MKAGARSAYKPHIAISDTFHAILDREQLSKIVLHTLETCQRQRKKTTYMNTLPPINSLL